VLFLITAAAYAQQIDFAIGAGTVSAPSSNFNTVTSSLEQSLRGGNFLTFSGDALIHKSMGIEGEVSWRTSRNLYGGAIPFRPLFWDFNGIYAPRFNKFLGAEVMAGIGAFSSRFYTGQYNCSYFGGCTNYTSFNHFMGDLGAGLRLYPVGNFFVRRPAHLQFWPRRPLWHFHRLLVRRKVLFPLSTLFPICHPERSPSERKRTRASRGTLCSVPYFFAH
jgi:hypothetical protein